MSGFADWMKAEAEKQRPKIPEMTLRDWFAGMAMQGELANPKGGGNIANIASFAYSMASAMLKAREDKP